MTQPIDVSVYATADISVDGVSIPKDTMFTAKLLGFEGFINQAYQPTIYAILSLTKVGGENHNGMIVPIPRKSVVISLPQKV